MKISFLPTYRFTHFAMGTEFEVVIAGRRERTAGRVAEAAFNEIDRIESLISRFHSQSEISRINRMQPGESIHVSAEVYECLQVALHIQRETENAFNINVRELDRIVDIPHQASESGYDMSFSQSLNLSQSSGNFQVSLRDDIDRKGIDLDLGGIGKGYALDKCLNVLSDWGIERALLQGSVSAVLAVGTPSEFFSGWSVGVAEKWECPEISKYVMLKDRALCGSGTDKKGEHIIDPRTGIPAQGHLATFVSHSSAAVADALSTAFMVMSTDEVKTYCEKHKHAWTMVVTNNKTCRVFNQEISSE